MKQAVLKRLSVSRETELRLETYADLLVAWQRIKNLVSPNTLETLWERHIEDSAQIVPLLGDATSIVDFGTGAGLPGVIIGILMRDKGVTVHLVESNLRKCAFLREAVRVTGASCIVHQGRVEDVSAQFIGKCDVVTARAFTNMTELLNLSAELLKNGALGLYFKGAHGEDEIAAAREIWQFDTQMIASRTGHQSSIVKVTGLHLKDHH